VGSTAALNKARTAQLEHFEGLLEVKLKTIASRALQDTHVCRKGSANRPRNVQLDTSVRLVQKVIRQPPLAFLTRKIRAALAMKMGTQAGSVQSEATAPKEVMRQCHAMVGITAQQNRWLMSVLNASKVTFVKVAHRPHRQPMAQLEMFALQEAIAQQEPANRNQNVPQASSVH